MINKDAIAKMKDGVILVNTGRGKCIVEEDLAAALASRQGRRLRHRRLTTPIRPTADCPLLTAPNVLMTPHIGASSKENLLRIGDVVVEILTGWAKK